MLMQEFIEHIADTLNIDEEIIAFNLRILDILRDEKGEKTHIDGRTAALLLISLMIGGPAVKAAQRTQMVAGAVSDEEPYVTFGEWLTKFLETPLVQGDILEEISPVIDLNLTVGRIYVTLADESYLAFDCDGDNEVPVFNIGLRGDLLREIAVMVQWTGEE